MFGMREERERNYKMHDYSVITLFFKSPKREPQALAQPQAVEEYAVCRWMLGRVPRAEV